MPHHVLVHVATSQGNPFLGYPILTHSHVPERSYAKNTHWTKCPDWPPRSQLSRGEGADHPNVATEDAPKLGPSSRNDTVDGCEILSRLLVFCRGIMFFLISGEFFIVLHTQICGTWNSSPVMKKVGSQSQNHLI